MAPHAGVNPELLEMLSQADFLSLSAKYTQQVAFGNTKDGIGLITASEIINNDFGYAQLMHFGRTAGAFTAHVIVISRNFLIPLPSSPALLTALFDNFANAARDAIACVESRIREDAARHADGHRHYLRFGLVANLVPTKGDIARAESMNNDLKVALTQSVFERLGDLTLASRANCVHPIVINHKFLASQIEPDELRPILEGYRRFVVDVESDGKVYIRAALLGGVHVLSGVRPPREALAKVSFLHSEYHNISEAVLAELASLVQSRATKEADLQRFFEEYPALLCDGRAYRIYPQITFERDSGSRLRPDFFLEVADSSGLWPDTLVDIKLPSESIILDQPNRQRFYAKIYEYAAQLAEYGRFLDGPAQRKRVEDRYGIRGLRPRLVMIVGRDYTRADYALIDQARRLINPVELRTYDDVLRFGRAIVDAQSTQKSSGPGV